MNGHDIVVIGASAGGVEALKALVATLPADLPAALFVVLHVSPHATSVLPEILTRTGKLPAEHADDGQVIEQGKIYVAPPNYHMLVKRGHIRLTQGPKENGNRPAIDVLFRTAARAYGERVVAVVMSGVLDDGSVGLVLVKNLGGVGIVQSPEDALYAGMPQNAIDADSPNFIVPVSEIGSILVRLAHEEVAAKEKPVMADHKDIVEVEEGGEPIKEPGGTPTTYVCPDCGGVMSEYRNGDLVRFRCQVGHAYSADSLIAKQSEAVENALWMALRTLDENAVLTRRLAQRSAERGHEGAAKHYAEKLVDIEANAGILRQILLNSKLVIRTED